MFATDHERERYLLEVGIPREYLPEVLHLTRMSDSRSVRKGSLRSAGVSYCSRTMQRQIEVESRTVELPFFLEAELFGGIREIYSQVRLPTIVTRSMDGRKVRTSPTADSLVLYRNGVALVECKAEEEATRNCRMGRHDWLLHDGKVMRPQHNAWAEQRGMRYVVWSPPKFNNLFAANLSSIHGLQPTLPPLRVDWLGRSFGRAAKRRSLWLRFVSCCRVART